MISTPAKRQRLSKPRLTRSKTFSRSNKPSRTLKWNDRVSMGKGFAKTLQFTHLYHDNVPLLQSNTGAVGRYVFSCNGMYDPDFTGTGHQPYYFDQLSAIYNHYTVIGAKIKVSVVGAASTTAAFRVSLTQGDDTVITNSTINGQAEQSSGSIVIVPSDCGEAQILTNNYSTKKTFGGNALSNDNLQGNSGANPTEQTFWIISLQAMDQLASVNIAFDVHIQYIAVWDELKDIVSS